MSRQPRIEYPGALHHVMSRGNDGTPIFRDDHDRTLFLEFLAEEVEHSRWILHDYCLMTNHYHLAIETPECTLSTGMHRFLSRYVQRFNRRHHRRGHLFEGRFKNVLAESESYLLTVSRYFALNPVVAGMVSHPENWAWSSYRARAGYETAPSWLRVEPVLGCFVGDRAAQQRAYREFVAEGIGETRDLLDEVIGQMFLGTAAWIDKVQKILDGEERSEEHPRATVNPGRPELEDVIDAVARTFDVTGDEIAETRGGIERQLVAYLAFEDGLVPLRKIARRLRVTSAGGISTLASRCRRRLPKDRELRELLEACRSRMRRRPPPFAFPRMNPPLTARRYHRSPSQSRR